MLFNDILRSRGCAVLCFPFRESIQKARHLLSYLITALPDAFHFRNSCSNESFGKQDFSAPSLAIFRLGQILTHFEVVDQAVSFQALHSITENTLRWWECICALRPSSTIRSSVKSEQTVLSSGNSFLFCYFLKTFWSQLSQCWNISWRGLFAYSFTWDFRFQSRSWAMEKNETTHPSYSHYTAWNPTKFYKLEVSTFSSKESFLNRGLEHTFTWQAWFGIKAPLWI